MPMPVPCRHRRLKFSTSLSNTAAAPSPKNWPQWAIFSNNAEKRLFLRCRRQRFMAAQPAFRRSPRKSGITGHGFDYRRRTIPAFRRKSATSRQLPVPFLPFSAIESEIAAFASEAWLMEFNKTPAQVLNIMSQHHIVPANMNDPCQQLKSVKNKTEISGFRQAHLHDGIAVCRFLCWLDHNRKPISEWQIVEKLRSFRQRQPLFYADSFATIAGSGANAAVIHYQPTPEHNDLLTKNSVLLLDSGAQYFNGTTDITRTIAIGRPAKEIIRNYTIVLKAHIALASLTFPANVAGQKMDTVCRSVMWRSHMDYAHGTGHGVGHFLNVHESPNNFSWQGSPQPLQAGNVTSIEPGYYKAGCYGIRIENLMYVAPIKNSDMMKFEFLTLVPLDKRLIDKYLLTGEERTWINKYHQTVYRKISPHLDNREKQWLQKVCSPL